LKFVFFVGEIEVPF